MRKIRICKISSGIAGIDKMVVLMRSENTWRIFKLKHSPSFVKGDKNIIMLHHLNQYVTDIPNECMHDNTVFNPINYAFRLSDEYHRELTHRSCLIEVVFNIPRDICDVYSVL